MANLKNIKLCIDNPNSTTTNRLDNISDSDTGNMYLGETPNTIGPLTVSTSGLTISSYIKAGYTYLFTAIWTSSTDSVTRNCNAIFEIRKSSVTYNYNPNAAFCYTDGPSSGSMMLNTGYNALMAITVSSGTPSFKFYTQASLTSLSATACTLYITRLSI